MRDRTFLYFIALFPLFQKQDLNLKIQFKIRSTGLEHQTIPIYFHDPILLGIQSWGLSSCFRYCRLYCRRKLSQWAVMKKKGCYKCARHQSQLDSITSATEHLLQRYCENWQKNKIIYLCDPSINLSFAGLKLLRLNKSLTHSNRLTEITQWGPAYDKTYTSTSLICPLINC